MRYEDDIFALVCEFFDRFGNLQGIKRMSASKFINQVESRGEAGTCRLQRYVHASTQISSTTLSNPMMQRWKITRTTYERGIIVHACRYSVNGTRGWADTGEMKTFDVVPFGSHEIHDVVIELRDSHGPRDDDD